MQRICLLLKVKASRLEEHWCAHENIQYIRPEMQDVLRPPNWSNFSLFLRDEGLLAEYLETEDFDRRAGAWPKPR